MAVSPESNSSPDRGQPVNQHGETSDSVDRQYEVGAREAECLPPGKVALAERVRTLLRQLLPPEAFSGSRSEQYEMVVEEAERALESEESTWLGDKTEADVVDLLNSAPEAFRSLIVRALNEPESLGIADGHIIAAHQDIPGRILEVRREIESIKAHVEELERQLPDLNETIRMVTLFKAVQGQALLESFQADKSSLPADFVEAMEEWLAQYRAPTSILHRIGLINDRKDKEAGFKEQIDSWLKVKTDQSGNCSTEVSRLNERCIQLSDWLANCDASTGEVFGAALLERLQSVVVKAQDQGGATGAQDLGRVLISLTAEISTIQCIQRGLDKIAAALAPTSPDYERRQSSFIEACEGADKAAEASEAARLVLAQAQKDYATCGDTSRMEPLAAGVRASETALREVLRAQERADEVLKRNINCLGEALCREAMRQVLGQEEQAREQALLAAQVLRERFSPLLSEAGRAEREDSAIKACAKGRALLEDACHIVIRDWITEEAGPVVLRDRAKSGAGSSGVPVEPPVIFVPSALKRRTDSGGAAVLFSSEFSSSAYCTKGEVPPFTPDLILLSESGSVRPSAIENQFDHTLAWPQVLPIISGWDGGWQIRCEGNRRGELWLPVSDQIDQEALEAALKAFSNRSHYLNETRHGCDVYHLSGAALAKFVPGAGRI